ncbi:MAG: hypothetical protein A2508_08565 [Candidatus Lambdaproteobacteria bacterium RIFOXYD12_FULL_49_8]|uniref:Methyltransferase type 11 domain-containing protein n=1 Tax=Candidatus Lambdaproteobacteria bacterium RIFOXYD2_FULL_50_16 TaxID=1817772 RepID=A0A1F6G6H5_9PROT|nr:MAG: hypothetical protein A2527_11350 [Candidatus Lambdaproteobacteria bacterium RIFOXYD2_FULL_50_16]OGG96517.1 MAG: hypothetical protein A2508_08565 [Candidatus Lambdaproteobacteria bacterium RIFOXYD12_FULL_49_8]
MADFSKIAHTYDYQALVQADAGEKLLELAKPRVGEITLDLGCGSGRFSRAIRRITGAPLVGLDASQAMITQARLGGLPLGLEYCVSSAEEIHMENYFDLIFCNSAFQWFKNPDLVLSQCHRSLKNKGRMAMQAPATRLYCPNFIKALEAVMSHPETGEILAGLQNPWLFLETAEDYNALFLKALFSEVQSEIQTDRVKMTLSQAMNVFESGAAAGYLDPTHYPSPYPPSYEAQFRQLFGDGLAAQQDAEGRIELIFNRIYLLALA